MLSIWTNKIYRIIDMLIPILMRLSIQCLKKWIWFYVLHLFFFQLYPFIMIILNTVVPFLLAFCLSHLNKLHVSSNFYFNFQFPLSHVQLCIQGRLLYSFSVISLCSSVLTFGPRCTYTIHEIQKLCFSFFSVAIPIYQ